MKRLITSCLKKTVLYSLCAYVAITVILFFSQDSLLYLPNGRPSSPLPLSLTYSPQLQHALALRQPSGLPASWPAGYLVLASLRDHQGQYPAQGVGTGFTSLSWLLVQEARPLERDTIIFFHENAGNIGARLDFLELLYRELRCNILVVAYRGYSDSQGSPSEAGLELDAMAVFHYAQASDIINQDRLYLFGRSLGGAVAIYLAEQVQPRFKGLILENTFTGISEMADALFFFIKPVKPFILRNWWPSIHRIANIKTPILFLSATKDEIVPSYMMQELYEKADAAKFKRFHKLPGGHNDSWIAGGDNYLKEIKKFMDEARNAEVAQGEQQGDQEKEKPQEKKNEDDL